MEANGPPEAHGKQVAAGHRLSNGWRGACSDSTAFFEMVRRRDDQQLHLHTWTLTERERERGGHVSGSKCSRSFKSSALSDFAKDEFAVFTTTAGSVYSPSEPLWLLTSRRVTITSFSGGWKARFLPSVFKKKRWSRSAPRLPRPTEPTEGRERVRSVLSCRCAR